MTRTGRREHPTWDHCRDLCRGLESYLVGGAARFMLEHEEKIPKDWDILIEDAGLALVVAKRLGVSDSPEETYLGGIRVKDPVHGQIEVFEEPVARFLRLVERAKDGIAIHFGTGAILMTDEYVEWHRTGVEFNVSSRPVRPRKAL